LSVKPTAALRNSAAVADLEAASANSWSVGIRVHPSTSRQACPTHEYVEGFPAFDITKPDDVHCRHLEVEDAAFFICYRHDGNGVSLASCYG
jgi:hypothetical protein